MTECIHPRCILGLGRGDHYASKGWVSIIIAERSLTGSYT